MMAGKVVKSDQPTVLIAPSDYEHIFKGDPDTIATDQKKTVVEVKAKKVSSDQPTIMIAPSDYEHIFKGSQDKKEDKTNRQIRKVASETPTILIAPSDFQHIYCDPTLQKKDEQIRKINKPEQSQKRDIQQKTRLPIERSKGNQRQQQQEKYTHQQEILPHSIIQLIERFIAKQKRAYTIQKPKSNRNLQ
ncbi:uncharacterized protein LOC113793361 [Dermatophagoides pteronyssinus]|uniref:Uncharacterized protein LOC113793361 n=1 Tax=Dermatophagoides pteronyssinus TaxID=6956 RepID=A0A6P6Y1P3_DERPT|nr:uncharacterized protein LOC113793361 [Dermatophagoides pteronyssinus]